MKIETQQYDENRLEGQKVLVSFWERKHSSFKKKNKKHYENKYKTIWKFNNSNLCHSVKML